MPPEGGLRPSKVDGTAYRLAGRGPTVVLVHGVGMGQEVWEAQVADLSRDHCVLAYDFLGHGGSDPAPGDADLDDYVTQLERLLDRLDLGPAVVVGHSMGGLVALGLALRRPERVRLLVALNTVFERDPESRRAVEARAAALRERGAAATVEATLDRWFGAAPEGAQAAARATARHLLERVDATGYATAYRVFATADDRFAGRLGDLAVPAVFATGEMDPNSTPSMSRRMAEAAPQGEAVILEEERHMMALASPKRVNRLLRDAIVRHAPPALDPRDLRRALGAFLTGVTVVTTLDEDGAPRGFTANSFTSVSLDPPLVLVCLARSASTHGVFRMAGRYAVNILSTGQRAISDAFASRVADRFAGVSWRREATGAPVIDGVAAWLDCTLHEIVEAGDHVVLIGRVLAFGEAGHGPLGYCRGSYVTFGLSQDALDADRRRIGAIVERGGTVLLLPRGTDGWTLPNAARFDRGGDRSLTGLLTALGLVVEIGFLFAVFEDASGDTLWVYYRGEHREGEPDPSKARFVPFAAIPWEDLPDDATRAMLRRYVDERERDIFGIYAGDASTGTVRKLERAP